MKLTRALRNTIGFVILALGVSVLVIYVQRSTNKTYQRNLPYLTLGITVKNNMMAGYAFFEKATAGDQSVKISRDVHPLWMQASTWLQGVYDGKENELGSFENTLPENSKALLKEAILAIDKLVQVSGEAETSHEAITVLYSRSLAALDKLTKHFNEDAAADFIVLNIFSWLSGLVLIVTFVFIGITFYRFHRHNDELVKAGAAKLEEETNRVQSLTSFIQAVSSGNYDIELKATGEEDYLTHTLITMRDTLHKNAQRDQQQNWATSGLAQIGEILRATSGTSTELFDKIIQFVVKYTHSNQGGLFIVNDEQEDDHYLELVAAYAFERKKFIQKKVDIGQGLVGQCFLEGERIYLLEVPEEYVHITSGLGGAVPTALLVVPMRANEKIFGVIELASFQPYQEFEIELVEKLAESIASTISSVKVNERTKELLERTQQQAEEMRAQEEEMRQNMEELEATQEEMRRKEKHVQKMLEDEKERNLFIQSNRKKLAELTKNEFVQAGDWTKTLEVMTSAIAHQIDVSRCSIWLYNSEEDKIQCAKLYQRSSNTYESGAELHAKDFPQYFKAIRKEEDIIATDAHTHPATQEFSEVYLAPLGIESMLDVPVFNTGRIMGVICCEHQHEQKNWTDDHVDFLKSCADLIALVYKSVTLNDKKSA